MKLESIPDLYFVVSVFFPGFIYQGVVRQFVPLRQNGQIELILLSFLTATAVNYALCSPFIYLLVTGHALASHPAAQAISWFAIIFISPVMLGLVHARLLQKGGLAPLYRALKLRPINPVPTGWDWVFSRAEPCFLMVTLKSGVALAGWFNELSMASSDPDSRDIFIEKVYTVDPSGNWQQVAGSEGVHINGSEIAFIEFRK